MKKETNDKENPATDDTRPMKNKEQVQQSNDEKIDQDYPGFPHAPATEETIKKTKTATK